MSSLLTHEIPGGAAWSVLLRAGRLLRLTALADGVNCSTLIYPAHDTVDRLNVPDTLKAQMSARIAAPMVLMSDRGLGLASVVSSTLPWHDALCGHGLDGHAAAFGETDYQQDRNAWRRSARFGLHAELLKHGRDAPDLHPSVNFFSKVATDDDGSLAWTPGHASSGDSVTLRAEVDLLVVLSTAPHPLDPRWQPGPVLAEVLVGAPYGDDDPSVRLRPESARALAAAKEVFV